MLSIESLLCHHIDPAIFYFDISAGQSVNKQFSSAANRGHSTEGSENPTYSACTEAEDASSRSLLAEKPRRNQADFVQNIFNI